MIKVRVRYTSGETAEITVATDSFSAAVEAVYQARENVESVSQAPYIVGATMVRHPTEKGWVDAPD